MELRIVSIDLFQTVVDLESRRHEIWREILDGRYTVEMGEECWRVGNQVISGIFDEIVTGKMAFKPLSELFIRCFSTIFRLMDLDLDPVQAAAIFSHQHARCEPFGDADPFFKYLSPRLPICLTSDANRQMLGSIDQQYTFDRIFISEAYRSYKLDPAGVLFNSVVADYNTPPAAILHIGDSGADVLGAARAGMQTCWLNRKGATWCHETAPDFVVTGLEEARALIEDKLPSVKA